MRKVFVLAILAVLSVSCGRQPKFGAHNSISLDLKIPYYKSCKVELVQAEPGVEDFFLGTYYFDSGQFMGYKCGQTWLKKGDGTVQLSAYRQFPDNPPCFNHPVRITVRAGEQNEINSDSEVNDDIYLRRGDATYGGVCYYYEW